MTVPRSRAVTAGGLAVRLVPLLATAALLGGCGGGSELTGTGVPAETPVRTPSGPAPEPASPASGGAGNSGTVAPVDGRSAADLLAAARAAFAAAPTVHVTGTIVPSGRSLKVDLWLKGPAGGTATITPSSADPAHAPEIRVIRIGGTAWVSGNLAFWEDVTGDEAQARSKAGTWVQVPARNGNFGEYVAYTWPETVEALLPQATRPATIAARVSMDGRPAIFLKVGDATQYTVAARGDAQPLQLQGLLTDKLVAYLTFTGYGAEVPLRAPDPGRVDGGEGGGEGGGGDGGGPGS